jgi:hypothetical protein
MKTEKKPDKKNILGALQAAIASQIKPHAEAPAPAKPPETAPPTPARAEKKSSAPVQSKPLPPPKAPVRSGRGVQFYLDDADRKIITNLATFLGAQDRRMSDSQVIKAAVRFASISPSARFIEICDEVRGLDRRRHAKKPKGSAAKP